MPFPVPTGYAPAQVTQGSFSDQPPQEVLNAIGGYYDQSRLYWDPSSMSLVDRATGQVAYDYRAATADPGANGSDVVTDLTAYNASRGQDGVLHYGPGQTPYFGFGDSAQGYNGGDAPNSGMFVSADPNAINDYQDHRQTVVNQGVAKVGALVGGAALGGALGGGGSTGGATTYPLPAAGGPITATPITSGVGAGTVAGSTTAAGVAGAANSLGTAASTVPKWLDYGLPAINAAAGIYASGKASDAESAGMDRALAENQRQFDLTRSDSMPWIQGGTEAINHLRDPAASYTASPGYAWARSEGQRDVGNSFAAKGGAASGNALRALSEFNTGLAQQDFGNWWNQQLGLAGMGSNTTANVGAAGSATAGRAGNYFANQGASRASGVLGKYGAIAGAGQDIYENYLYRRKRAA